MVPELPLKLYITATLFVAGLGNNCTARLFVSPVLYVWAKVLLDDAYIQKILFYYC